MTAAESARDESAPAALPPRESPPILTIEQLQQDPLLKRAIEIFGSKVWEAPLEP